jgi:hypothetical protein
MSKIIVHLSRRKSPSQCGAVSNTPKPIGGDSNIRRNLNSCWAIRLGVNKLDNPQGLLLKHGVDTEKPWAVFWVKWTIVIHRIECKIEGMFDQFLRLEAR